ncbi:type III restriction-modification system endonuclease [Aggregatibacter actinomycetemcomitans]|uniref:type III restriction-modification system endonuclease n=1 Tax=Aggregatibacter actinomycetemcomitans TaxID=714 RepID=UPI001EB5B240|nr:type III restriction-modification system endonuclease [Aggregatibacter actinomycetemcomitans]MBN6063313.1 type III restriction-modification system endonuclease [Aggregatibacter actinomycetemcomitans]MBN6081022.1 type III restriction-modification system endonuclease [Aggregatibacter actinomycetemcomitans]MBN6084674.1 type III restriction-modification system endonuclease [Aggregatibacter actinomycetemcomitans]
MSGFNYEKNLPHQEAGIQAVLSVFDGVTPKQHFADENPELIFAQGQYERNLQVVQNANQIDRTFDGSNVLDISMETGTGKTYTYTKTMYDLHRMLGVFKFIVVVPTLSIKAGTKYFLESPSLAKHFRQDFGNDYDKVNLKTYVVESQKTSKGKKSHISAAIDQFVKAENQNEIHVLLINAGMINSPSMTENSDRALKDMFDVPQAALAAVRPMVIIDEPHKFPTAKKTWENIKRLNPQYILRYGATFNEQYHNLIYRLTAVDAFNQDLVKGVRVFCEEQEGGVEAQIKLTALSGTEATFELTENGKDKKFYLSKGDELAQIHSAIFELKIEAMNKTTLVLSNGLELKTGAIINPYSYAETVQDAMMKKAISEHFKLECELLTQTSPKIKPLTLFFIDDIAGYRNGNEIAGSLKEKFESWVLAEAKCRLKTEDDPFYRDYLAKTIADVSLTHGGYFSKDNSESDEKIEQEVNEILHDKEALLSLDNPRRFIFSKWTLREGWDNPNVFQICKLRSSGSTTSKLQEVGRGLRLPVNELMERVRSPQYRLNYFVDNSEKDFVAELVVEVNQSSETEQILTALSPELLEKIKRAYPQESNRSITNKLADNQLIDDNDHFVSSAAYQQVKQLFPNAFAAGLHKGKITDAKTKGDVIPMREGKYEELKALWELIHYKAILQYKIDSEADFLALFVAYLQENADKFKQAGIRTKVSETYIKNNVMLTRDKENLDDTPIRFNTMTYREFLENLSAAAKIKMTTLHQAFYQMRETLDISQFLNMQTIAQIKSGFNQFLLNHSFSKFELGYQLVNNAVHPTKFTDKNGNAKAVRVADLGQMADEIHEPAASYLFGEIFYDSEIEHQNIANEEIEGVTVFTKIPKNSIKIPVAGGGTYSPDFAYIVKTKTGEILNFVIEAKGVDGSDSLRRGEERKIKHAERLFEEISKEVKVVFKTQFEGDRVAELIMKTITSLSG